LKGGAGELGDDVGMGWVGDEIVRIEDRMSKVS